MTNAEAYAKWEETGLIAGCKVRVTLANGEDYDSFTENEPWQSAEGVWLVKIQSISIPYQLEAVTPLGPLYNGWVQR